MEVEVKCEKLHFEFKRCNSHAATATNTANLHRLWQAVLQHLPRPSWRSLNLPQLHTTPRLGIRTPPDSHQRLPILAAHFQVCNDTQRQLEGLQGGAAWRQHHDLAVLVPGDVQVACVCARVVVVQTAGERAHQQGALNLLLMQSPTKRRCVVMC